MAFGMKWKGKCTGSHAIIFPAVFPLGCSGAGMSGNIHTHTYTHNLVKLFYKDLRSFLALNLNLALIHYSPPILNLHPGINSLVDVCTELKYSLSADPFSLESARCLQLLLKITTVFLFFPV